LNPKGLHSPYILGTQLDPSNEITTAITVANKNYNYGNNKEIFNISNYISAYAEDTVDKQTSCAVWSYFQDCRYLCSCILAGVRQLCLLATQTVGMSI